MPTRPVRTAATVLVSVAATAGVIAAGSHELATAPGGRPPTRATAPGGRPPTRATAPGGRPMATATRPPAAWSPTADSGAVVGVVSRVIDGDTVDVEGIGRIRIIGIDTPDRGQCGYSRASDLMRSMVLGHRVQLTPSTGKDDRDKYGRVLRYVDVGGTDAGLEEIRQGLAVARYDSRDGYGAHPRESAYVAADDRTPPRGCGGTPTVPPSAAPAAPTAAPAGPTAGAEPWNRPGPDLNCSAIGHKVAITGPDYHHLDGDHDGWGCQSYG